MVPCQDTPAVKAQYSATVSVPAPLTIVMSANERRQVQAGEQLNIYKFSQTTAIPVRKTKDRAPISIHALSYLSSSS